MKLQDKVIDFFKGLAIGIAFLIPGVSGATIAFLTKVYDKLVDSIANIFKNFISSILTILPIALGALAAIFAMWIPLKLGTQHFLFAIICLFVGAMIGSAPSIVEDVKKEEIKSIHYLCLLVAILCGMSLGILSYHCNLNVDWLFNNIDYKLYLIIIPVGFLAACGIVVPGISGSMLLLVLGFYTKILGLIDIIKNNSSMIGPVIGVLACMLLGVILGCFFFSKIMKVLFQKFHNGTRFAILGLVIGSIFSLFYNREVINYYQIVGVKWYEGLVAAIFLIVGITLSYCLLLYRRRIKNAS